jgi:hypothetical protein
MGDEVQITVIATSFGAAKDERMPRPLASASAAHAEPRDAVATADGRLVRRHGPLATTT